MITEIWWDGVDRARRESRVSGDGGTWNILRNSTSYRDRHRSRKIRTLRSRQQMIFIMSISDQPERDTFTMCTEYQGKDASV